MGSNSEVIKPEDTFEKMVVNNTINDYYTPNIKAEVILDMMLTNYIPALIEAKTGSKATLITKEMSIGYAKEPEGKVSNRGKKADYIVCDENYIYLVELKTTHGSLRKEQIKIYLELQGKRADDLLVRLCNILSRHPININKEADPYQILKAYLKDKLTNSQHGLWLEEEFDEKYEKAVKDHALVELVHNYQKKNNVSSTNKYIHTIACIMQNSTKEDWMKEIKVIYISPEGVKASPIENITFKSIEEDPSEVLKEFKSSILYQEIIKPLYI